MSGFKGHVNQPSDNDSNSNLPCPGEEYILDTDASNYGIGAVLSQIQGGEERVIGYYSRSLNKAERNYCVTRKELLAVVAAVEHFHYYLYGQKFTVRTDHSALQWLLSFKNIQGQLARWLQKLQQYDFVVIHRVGKSHSDADALSRLVLQQSVNIARKLKVQSFWEILALLEIAASQMSHVMCR